VIALHIVLLLPEIYCKKALSLSLYYVLANMQKYCRKLQLISGRAQGRLVLLASAAFKSLLQWFQCDASQFADFSDAAVERFCLESADYKSCRKHFHCLARNHLFAENL
jgi:hypothetical protein